MMTKQEFLKNSNTPELAKAVLEQMGANWEEVIEYPTDYRDASAGVSGFCYYSETETFAQENIKIILEAVNEFEEEMGEPLKKDNDNLLNWYAWFALEHIIDQVMMAVEV